MKNWLQTIYSTLNKKVAYNAQNKYFMHYILGGNFIFIILFAMISFLLTQNDSGNYYNIKTSLSNLKIVSNEYQQKLIEAQVKFKPDIDAIENLLNIVSSEKKAITYQINKISNQAYKRTTDAYIDILSKRLTIKDELINQYQSLSTIYKDYLIASQNAEKIAASNIQLQIAMKDIMLSLEKVRIMSQGQNRDFILNKINTLRSKMIHEAPAVQEKIGLFCDLSDKIIKILRYVDTMRHSMNSDGHDQTLDQINTLTNQNITYEEVKFYGQLILFLILSASLLFIQILLLIMFFINKRKTTKIKQEAEETISRSQEMSKRAKIYALDAQRNQYKLLHDFCGDFDIIIKTVTDLSISLKEAVDHEDDYEKDDHGLGITTLNIAIVALNRWLSNYLELYTAKDTWPTPTEEAINITELFDSYFAEARFFIADKQHLLSIVHSNIEKKIKTDKQYAFKLFLNMMYISIKWGKESWLRSSISLVSSQDIKKDTQDQIDEERAEQYLELSILNGASEEQFQEDSFILKKDPSTLQSSIDNNNNNTEEKSEDRFITASLYYIRQICEQLKATIHYERNTKEENILSVRIPVTTEDIMQDIGVPVLKNKNILIVSQFGPIQQSLEKQLKTFGLNVKTLGDRYSAIGHIVDINDSNPDEGYDLFIIDHNPPEIDADALTKIIRENSYTKLAHVILITTEENASHIDQYKSLYDAHFIKPVMPELLKTKLEELINIQLYGTESNLDFDENITEELDGAFNCLTLMQDDISSIILQYGLKKSDLHIDIASSIAQAFEFIEEKKYHYIFVSYECDWVIADNFAKDIRRHHTENKDSVLMLYSNELKDSQIDNLKYAGYDEFMALPPSSETFIEALDKWQDPFSQRVAEDDPSFPTDDSDDMAV